jgi:hypothetical protein
MPPAAEICESHASADYRRKARRLRRVYAGRPGQLYRHLTELAQAPPVPPPVEPFLRRNSAGTGGTPLQDELPFRVAWAGTPARAVRHAARAEVPAHATPDVDSFARIALLQFEGTILRYSRRLALLKIAGQMNIGRFEANLIIALIQHRLNNGEIEPDTQVQSTAVSSSFPRFLVPLTTFVLLQSAIIWGMCHILL